MVKMKRYALLITGALLISLAGCTGTHTPAGEADGTDMASRIVYPAEPEEERSSADENTKTGTESTETAPAAADSAKSTATVEAEEAIRQEEESKTPQISETPAGQQGEGHRNGHHPKTADLNQTQDYPLAKGGPVTAGALDDQSGYAYSGGGGKQRLAEGSELAKLGGNGQHQHAGAQQNHSCEAQNDELEGG